MDTKRLELAVLDMAGTTVNENGCVERAVSAALTHVGAPPPDAAALHAMRGLPKPEMFRRLLRDDERAEAAHREFTSYLLAAISDGQLQPCSGAEDTLRSLRGGGVKVCLATGFEDQLRQALLEHLGWFDLIDLSLSPAVGVRGRPFPDVIFVAMMRLQASGVQSVLVAGDTTNDLLSGYRAGAGTIVGVLGGAHTRDELMGAPHTHLADGIGHLLAAIQQPGRTPSLDRYLSELVPST